MTRKASPDYDIAESDLLDYMINSPWHSFQHRAYDRVISEGIWLDREDQNKIINSYLWNIYGFSGI